MVFFRYIRNMSYRCIIKWESFNVQHKILIEEKISIYRVCISPILPTSENWTIYLGEMTCIQFLHYGPWLSSYASDYRFNVKWWEERIAIWWDLQEISSTSWGFIQLGNTLYSTSRKIHFFLRNCHVGSFVKDGFIWRKSIQR